MILHFSQMGFTDDLTFIVKILLSHLAFSFSLPPLGFEAESVGKTRRFLFPIPTKINEKRTKNRRKDSVKIILEYSSITIFKLQEFFYKNLSFFNTKKNVRFINFYINQSNVFLFIYDTISFSIFCTSSNASRRNSGEASVNPSANSVFRKTFTISIAL